MKYTSLILGALPKEQPKNITKIMMQPDKVDRWLSHEVIVALSNTMEQLGLVTHQVENGGVAIQPEESKDIEYLAIISEQEMPTFLTQVSLKLAALPTDSDKLVSAFRQWIWVVSHPVRKWISGGVWVIGGVGRKTPIASSLYFLCPKCHPYSKEVKIDGHATITKCNKCERTIPIQVRNVKFQ